jgi:hypothetical protein
VSGRIKKDVSASFFTSRFLVPGIIVVFALAVIVWFLRGRP